MKLSQFDYDLPEELIAQHPLKRREQARLMVIDRLDGSIRHDHFKNVDQYLPKESLVVLNDSRVIPARLIGEREVTKGKVEVFLLRKIKNDATFEVLIKPLKRLKDGDKILFKNGIEAQLIDREKRVVKFNKKDILKYLTKIGHIPLPPYINREDNSADKKYYQTVYAKHLGSVASPTAGLHFTNPLLKKIENQGHGIKKVTLHINYGTFKPVEVENIKDHPMHSEQYSISQGVLKELQTAKKRKRKIVAVGTTSCRVLETIGSNAQLSGETDIFIYPGYDFKMVDALITNYHLPRSTLLMLVYAFGGSELMKKAYQEAIKEKYRFYSYGDAMMII